MSLADGTATALTWFGGGIVVAGAVSIVCRRRLPVIAFIARRAVFIALTTALVYAASFALMRHTPGGPFDTEHGKLAPEMRAALMAHYGLDRPPLQQGLDAAAHALHGDLRPSLRLRDFDAGAVIASGLGHSIRLGVPALMLAVIMGLAVGIAGATRPRSWVDRSLTAALSLALALPSFVIASLLLVPLGFVWHVLPVGGHGSWQHLVMPAIALAVPVAAMLARLVRAGLLEQLGRDHVRTARAKGLSPARVLLVHALPGALLPAVSALGPAAAQILTGSLVVESVFGIPGLGTHFVQSAVTRDYPVALGAVVVYTLLLLTFNAIADAVYRTLDPRVEVL